jgi:hypothetical protein
LLLPITIPASNPPGLLIEVHSELLTSFDLTLLSRLGAFCCCLERRTVFCVETQGCDQRQLHKRPRAASRLYCTGSLSHVYALLLKKATAQSLDTTARAKNNSLFFCNLAEPRGNDSTANWVYGVSCVVLVYESEFQSQIQKDHVASQEVKMHCTAEFALPYVIWVYIRLVYSFWGGSVSVRFALVSLHLGGAYNVIGARKAERSLWDACIK